MNRGKHKGPERRGENRGTNPETILTALKQERARVTALVAQIGRLEGPPLAAADATVKAKRKTKVEIEAEQDAVAKEKFHQLHTFLLAPANMISQMTCVAVFLNPGQLLREPEWAEGVRFFIYGVWGYAIPAMWLVFFHWGILSKAIKQTIALVVLSIIGIGAGLAYFDG